MAMAQKLIETIRDLMSKLAVWNNSRQQGAWYYRAEWALAANRKVFARNWRTYHLREALAVSASSGISTGCAPRLRWAALPLPWTTACPRRSRQCSLWRLFARARLQPSLCARCWRNGWEMRIRPTTRSCRSWLRQYTIGWGTGIKR